MSNYRQQSGGTLGNLTTCPTCYDTLYLLKGSSVTNVCCDSGGITVSPTYETVYVAQGQTFATATMWYDDTSLTTPSGNAWWTDDPNLGSRSYRRLTRDAGGNNPALGTVLVCDTCSSSQGNIKESSATVGDNTAYDACCGSDQPSTHLFAYGKTFLTASYIYAAGDTDLLTPLTGFFYSINDGKVRQFNGSSQAGSANSCATCFETLTGIRYSNTEAEDVCCDVTATGTYYVAEGETFDTATTLYTNSTLTTVAPGGFYSND